MGFLEDLTIDFFGRFGRLEEELDWLHTFVIILGTMTGLARLELQLSDMLVPFELSLELFLTSKMEEIHNSGGVPIFSEMHLDLNFEGPISMICMLEADVTLSRQTGLSLVRSIIGSYFKKYFSVQFPFA